MAATGVTITQLAKSHGYTKQAFYDVIKGRTRTRQIRQLISALTGIDSPTLWPETAAPNSTKKKCPARNSKETSAVGDVLGSSDPNSGGCIEQVNFSHAASMAAAEE